VLIRSAEDRQQRRTEPDDRGQLPSALHLQRHRRSAGRGAPPVRPPSPQRRHLPALAQPQQTEGAHLSLTPVQALVDVVQLVRVEPAD
jgi:hypothetical protein